MANASPWTTSRESCVETGQSHFPHTMAGSWAAQAVVAALLGILAYLLFSRKRASHVRPPGPRPLPVVGNLLDFPPKGVPEFEHWLKHKDAYGPVSSVSVMGKTLVLLHGRQAAEDLLGKQSKKSSGRPEMEFANRLCGYGDLMACQQDDERFRRCRRLVHQQLGTQAALAKFSDTQELETRRFLLRVLDRPERLFKQLKVLTGAIILKMTYGYTIEPMEADPLIDLIEVNMANFPLAMVPMTWMVDLIPALKHLPDGFPGTAFKETARRWNKINRAVADVPYSFVWQQMASGRHQPSFVSNLIEQKRLEGKELVPGPDEHDIKWTAAVMYGGGSAALAAQMTSFVLAMVMFPEVQRRAQDEIDRVVRAVVAGGRFLDDAAKVASGGVAVHGEVRRHLVVRRVQRHGQDAHQRLVVVLPRRHRL
ncbi:hypothetical protein HIM_09156 [Hirsutella minnesotensis 3608]|uniref:O-methylsterigmatocystin oxidoreductase n=1 Tax=Hirsutella minnesotensis 3608 TaxID=1043627 RepID=A0A0F7ZXW5_9HYPO|nr:hypothetical protein HIM_09156 [Hirsutella minnesotensis 3608]